ncbi:Uncharacterized protein AArcCO_0537 [Halalkaliarchaeum sp. AArc-CO]|uniref:DUF7547 family protein n=1 Tax=unclassified Halalkaliarchaeum TaxID=2678344 RepID=UPI00217D67B3|nr:MULTISPECIES: hypothetical protein [unclassified Halalkaliarchaeum]MDR5673464.1 hypothetical protein [Halalkaliarchaeum sp. AArc-GB]UWG49860.1 Uncharacterized protein AArcCO_0537 [Halalkaliarchaeum sp. AArc-CO]
MSARDDEELRELLGELESTLEELRTQLRAEGRSRGLPRPPTPGELLRFTDRYTIPTVIAMLEATIRSLELLQAVLRLADPNRSGIEAAGAGHETRDRLSGARTEASNQLSSALSQLRTALSEANENLPDEPEARSVIEDARELSREIERKLDGEEQREGTGAGRDSGASGPETNDTSPSGAVTIDVTGESDERSDSADAQNEETEPDELEGPDGDEESNGDEEPEVDVDAELESIKRELGDGESRNSDSDQSSDADGEDPDDTPADN